MGTFLRPVVGTNGRFTLTLIESVKFWPLMVTVTRKVDMRPLSKRKWVNRLHHEAIENSHSGCVHFRRNKIISPLVRSGPAMRTAFARTRLVLKAVELAMVTVGVAVVAPVMVAAGAGGPRSGGAGWDR